MKIYKNLSDFIKTDNLCATIGTFDGVHCGHKKIISKMLEITRKTKGESLIITFEPHPRIVLGKDPESLSFINTTQEKIKLFEQLDINHVLIIEFTKEFSKLSMEDFIKIYLKQKLDVKNLIVGYDHMFGNKNKSSDINLKTALSNYNIKYQMVEAEKYSNVAVSSTKIRKALFRGDIIKANKFLGYNYSFSANVVSGRKIGRTIGFPTANLDMIAKNKIIPKDGVYHVEVEYENHVYQAVMNIGLNPTVKNKYRTIEVHILDFDKNIYNKNIVISIIKRIRGEMKFNSIEELRRQIQNDIYSIG